MNTDQVNSLQPGDHFYIARWSNHFRTSNTEFYSITEILCILNSTNGSDVLIFVPRPFGNRCNLFSKIWIDQTLARQWNHIWMNRSKLIELFLRKTEI